MRISEVIHLKKEDFNFEANEILIKNSKGNVDRKVYIHSLIKESIIHEFKKHDSIKNAFNITKDFICYTFQKINNELNYKKHITPHSLRHGGAKFLLKEGMPINELKIFLGHQDLKTTEIYINANEEEVKDTYLKKIKYKIGRKK